VRHGILKQMPQLVLLPVQFLAQVRGEHQNTLLRQCALDEGVNVGVGEAEVLDTGRLVAEVVEEAGQGVREDVAGILTANVGDVDAKGLGGLEVAFWVGSGGELHHQSQ
jgi:hypothetical protein